jgi:hypothetical protein
MHALGVSIAASMQVFQKIIVHQDFVFSSLRCALFLGEDGSYRFNVKLKKTGDFLFFSALIERSDCFPDMLGYHKTSSAGLETGGSYLEGFQPEAATWREMPLSEAPFWPARS